MYMWLMFVPFMNLKKDTVSSSLPTDIFICRHFSSLHWSWSFSGMHDLEVTCFMYDSFVKSVSNALCHTLLLRHTPFPNQPSVKPIFDFFRHKLKWNTPNAIRCERKMGAAPFSPVWFSGSPSDAPCANTLLTDRLLTKQWFNGAAQWVLSINLSLFPPFGTAFLPGLWSILPYCEGLHFPVTLWVSVRSQVLTQMDPVLLPPPLLAVHSICAG